MQKGKEWKLAKQFKMDSAVLKVNWSPVGHMLAISCQSGKVMVAKEDTNGQWSE